jgi:hypothetical protein
MQELLANPMCLFITANTPESLVEAKSLCGHLIKTTEQKYIEFKRTQPPMTNNPILNQPNMRPPQFQQQQPNPMQQQNLGPQFRGGPLNNVQPQINMQPQINQFRPRQMIGGPLMPQQQVPILPQKKAIVDPLDQNIGTFGNVGFFQPKSETSSIFNTPPTSTAQPTPQPRKRRFQEGDEVDQKVNTSKIALEKKRTLDRRLMPPPPVAVVLVTRAKRKLEEQKSQDVESIGSFKLVSYT